MLKGRNSETIGMVLLIILYALPAHAASGSTGTTFAPLGITLAIAYLTRRMSIGGWLFYYYFQLYGSILLGVLLGAVMLNNLSPNGWDNKALYTLFLISTVPIYLLMILQAIFATKLLIKSKRNLKNVKTLRYILLASVVVYAIGVAIDYYHFPENVGLSVFGLIFALIWTLYFFFSYRVNYVMLNWPGKWDYQSFKKRGMPKHQSDAE